MSNRFRGDGTRIPGPDPIDDGRVRWGTARLKPETRDAIIEEARRRQRSSAWIIGEILEEWHTQRLLDGLDE